MAIADFIFVFSILLVIAMVAASVCRHLPIPYTVLLVVLGLGVNLFSASYTMDELAYLSSVHLTPDLVLFVFLPALVFESALLLDARALLKNIVPILMLAIVGMLVSAGLVGLGLWWSLGMQLSLALLFGSLISATDPVAVVALFKELGVSRRLGILVEGESLMNDATAIVLFTILLAMINAQSVFTLDIGIQAVLEFFRVFLGGVLVGVCLSVIASEMLVRLFHGDQSIPVIFSLVLAYLSFIIAEHHFHVSGVMAVLSAALCLNIVGFSRLSKPTIDAVHNTWSVIVLMFNSLLFVLIGLSVNLFQLVEHWQSILSAVVAVYLARAVSVYVLVPFTTRSFSLLSIARSEQHIMWWGGLKGGLAIAIVMSIPNSLPEKELLVSLTLGVVIVSLLLNASTIRALMHFLKMDLLSKSEQAELKQSMQQVTRSVDKTLHQFATLHLLDPGVESTLEDSLHLALDAGEIALSDEALIRQAHLGALRAEADEIQYLYDIGVVNYYTLVTFKDILRTDQKRSIDYLTSMGEGWIQKNRLLDIEHWVIHALSEHDWAQGILATYQARRFANKILHDLAGVMMAHEGLKAIQNTVKFGLEVELIRPIQHIYQKRLKRRQNRLHYFSENYPRFYRRYEAFLFQKVALRYSLQLVHKSHDQGVISEKVLQVINKKLTDSLEQLTSFKMSMRIVERHGWLNAVPLFANLPTDFLKRMSHEAHYVNFLPDDVLFYQGDVGDSLYIILSGEVKVFISNAETENRLVAERGEGALIGIRALIHNSNRSATVMAKTYVTCLRLTSKDILQFSSENQELNERLQQTGLLKHNEQ